MSIPRRALLVIDVQNEYVDGGLQIEYPDPRQSLANVGRALDAAHAHGVPVVIVQNFAAPDAPLFARGTHGAELHPVVARRPRALYLEKSLPSAFTGTSLAEWIAQHGIDTLTVVGYMTHNCDDATIRHALHAGLAVEFLSDAAGAVAYANRAGAASAEEIHRVFCVVLQSRFAAVLSTDEWIGLLGTGAAAQRETIFGSHRNARPAAA